MFLFIRTILAGGLLGLSPVVHADLQTFHREFAKNFAKYPALLHIQRNKTEKFLPDGSVDQCEQFDEGFVNYTLKNLNTTPQTFEDNLSLLLQYFAFWKVYLNGPEYIETSSFLNQKISDRTDPTKQFTTPCFAVGTLRASLGPEMFGTQFEATEKIALLLLCKSSEIRSRLDGFKLGTADQDLEIVKVIDRIRPIYQIAYNFCVNKNKNNEGGRLAIAAFAAELQKLHDAATASTPAPLSGQTGKISSGENNNPVKIEHSASKPSNKDEPNSAKITH